MVPLHLAQAQQQEDRADGVGLAPDGAVEPGDGVDEDDQRGNECPLAVDTKLGREEPDRCRESQVGEYRDELHALADVAAGQEADRTEEQHVDGRIVDESRPVVETNGTVLGDVIGPVLERRQVGREARPWQQNVCDDEAKDQTQGQEYDDGGNPCDGTTRDGTTRFSRRGPLWAVLSRARSCHPFRPPGRALRWSGV